MVVFDSFWIDINDFCCSCSWMSLFIFELNIWNVHVHPNFKIYSYFVFIDCFRTILNRNCLKVKYTGICLITWYYSSLLQILRSNSFILDFNFLVFRLKVCSRSVCSEVFNNNYSFFFLIDWCFWKIFFGSDQNFFISYSLHATQKDIDTV